MLSNTIDLLILVFTFKKVEKKTGIDIIGVDIIGM